MRSARALVGGMVLSGVMDPIERLHLGRVPGRRLSFPLGPGVGLGGAVDTEGPSEHDLPCCGPLRVVIGNRRTALNSWAATRTVVIPDRDPKSSAAQVLSFCPFCSARLPDLTETRLDVLDEQGLLDHDDALESIRRAEASHPEFGTSDWWTRRLEADPRALDRSAPALGTILSMDDARGRIWTVLVIGTQRDSEPKEMLVRVVREGAASPVSALYVTSTWAFSRGRWPTVGADSDAAAQIAPTIRWGTWNGDESATPPDDWQLNNPASDASPNLKWLVIPYPPEAYFASELAAELGDQS